MRIMQRQVNTPYAVPDYTARSLHDIDYAELKRRGVRFVAFDADGTLVPFRGKSIAEETVTFLNAQKDLFDGWCIASNRLFYGLGDIGKTIDAPLIQAQLLGRKPRREFFQRVIDAAQVNPDQIVMIGDKLFADIWGAKRSGLVTVWVEHLGKDSPWDRLLRTRKHERRILEKYSAL